MSELRQMFVQVSILLRSEAVLHSVACVACDERLQSAVPQGHSPAACPARKSQHHFFFSLFWVLLGQLLCRTGVCQMTTDCLTIQAELS